MFERISETRKPIYVVEQILKSLKTGDLNPGDRLPAEAKRSRLTEVSGDSEVLPLKRELHSRSA